jgi:hypothetical protein
MNNGRIELDSPTAKTTDWDKVTLPAMQEVKSSSITHIGHSGTDLFVRFAKGTTYHYAGISADQFNALASAESAGKHLREHILHKHQGVRLKT